MYQRTVNGQVQTVERSKYYRMQQELGSWPANSPELNIIEEVWGWIENRLHKQAPIYKKEELMARARGTRALGLSLDTA